MRRRIARIVFLEDLSWAFIVGLVGLALLEVIAFYIHIEWYI